MQWNTTHKKKEWITIAHHNVDESEIQLKSYKLSISTI